MFPQVFGKFVLEKELSSGGMARVFVATLRGAVGFQKRLVVKQIRPELASDARFVERFVEEAKTSVELTHPNIVPVYELGVESGVYYIAMELCPGVTLAELLSAEGALEPEEGAYVGVELARALGYAHRRAGIVHRDVTPRNVLIDDEGAVRLIDFGIAAPVASDESADREVFGTPGHMPPEQIRGDRLTAATDVFALAALLVETWTGKAPFRRPKQEESLRAVWLAPPPLAESVSRLKALESLISACLATEPKARPDDIDELGRALRDFLREADAGDVARAVGKRVRKVRRASRGEAPLRVRAGTAPLTPAHASTASVGRTSGTTPLESERDSKAGSNPRPGSVPSIAPYLSRTFATRPLPPSADVDSLLAEADGGRPDDFAGTRRVPSSGDASGSSALGAAGSPSMTPSASRAVVWVLAALGIVGAGLTARAFGGAPAPSAESSAPLPNASSDVSIQPASRGSSSLTLPAEQGNASEARASSVGSGQGAAEALPTAAPVALPSVKEVRSRSGAQPEPSAARVPEVASGQPRITSPASESSATNAAVSELGIVSLTSAPSARVSIAGRTLATPVKRLELPGGTYRATFQSPTWDGGISADVVVAKDKPRSVHADFTSEPPRVVVR